MEDIQPRNKNVVINPLTPSGRSQRPVVQTKMVSFIKCYHWISRITEHTALAMQSPSPSSASLIAVKGQVRDIVSAY